MAAGNCSILVVVDSRCIAEQSGANNTVYAALDHFGVAWDVLDAADYWAVSEDYVRNRAAYLLAHDQAGAAVSANHAAWIREAVRDGAGFLSLDRHPAAWPDALQALAPTGTAAATTQTLRFSDTSHFITSGHAPGSRVELFAPASGFSIADPDLHGVLMADNDQAVLAAGSFAAGRRVYFGLGDQVYREDVLGHTRGLDGLLWRSLVWIARKPFPMRCIPPFLSSRMDDCNGTYSAFAYVEGLNRHGIRPNLGLFVDELGPSDWAAVSRLYRGGGADFSMHAFRDDLHKANPKWNPHAFSADKPDLSKDGTDCRFEGLGLDHTTGRDLDDHTVRRNVERMDQAFAKAGITHSRVLNSHFGEIGLRVLPHFLERGVDLPCNNSVIGQLYGNQPVWRPRPYGLRAANGRYGLVIDRLPQHPAFTSIAISGSHLGHTHMTTDILHGHTPFAGEAEKPRLEEAIQRGLLIAQVGLDSLAFGVIFTHEQRINSLSVKDWEYVVNGIVAGLKDCDYEPAAREQVSIICKRLFNSKLTWTHCDGTSLTCELTGQTDGPSPLTVWNNEGQDCRRTRVEVPEINGFLKVTL